ncbi:MAG TPA: serine--tRNA ligase, partial [Oscillospiraceae bacterium]|nr:serine--tRNA ligase [Oscillospiraceae bacterium]
MLDIRFIRENPDKVKEACKRRNKDMDADVDEILAIDAERRKINTQADEIKAEQNRASKQIPVLKQSGEDVSGIMAEMKTLADEARELGNRLSELEDKQKEIILRIPNIPHESVPYGRDDRDNLEVRRWGEPRKFDFEPKAHWDIGSALDILDPERAAKVTGARFHFYRGFGAKLERAIMNYYLDFHSANGYTEIFPPYMANKASMTGTGQ